MEGAGDAVVNADGSLVKGPKALCELQGYVYDAWLRMAEIFDEFGKSDAAQLSVPKRRRYSIVSMRLSGTRNLASTHTRWTAIRKRS